MKRRVSYDEIAEYRRVRGGNIYKSQYNGGRLLAEIIGKVTQSRREFIGKLNDGIAHGKFPGMPSFSGPDQMRELFLQWHSAALFYQNGCNTFRLSDGLAAMFSLTDVEIDHESFALPYPAFAVSVPDRVVPYFGDDGLLWVRHIAAYTSIARRTGDTEDSLYYTQMMCTEDGRMMWNDWPVIDLVERGGKLLGDADACTSGADSAHEKDQLTGTGAIRVVLNLARWLDRSGSTKADVRRVVADTKMRTWACGESVKLRTELRRVAEERALGFTADGWKLRQKHVVRGHWKMQVAGSARAERKRIFVEPYWRGPEGAEAWERLYEAAADGGL